MNYYVKHLVQDLEGQPSETLSWLEDYRDPTLISRSEALVPEAGKWQSRALRESRFAQCESPGCRAGTELP